MTPVRIVEEMINSGAVGSCLLRLLSELIESVQDERGASLSEDPGILDAALDNLDIYLSFSDELTSLVADICEEHRLRTGEDQQMCAANRNELGECVRDIWLFRTEVSQGPHGIIIKIRGSGPPKPRTNRNPSDKKDDPKTPAEPSERVFGSSANRPGSAASGSADRVTVPGMADKAIKDKAAAVNADAKHAWQKTSPSTLRKVWRRGAGAFSTSHRPSQTRSSWAMARVNAFLHLLKTGKPKRAAYTQDNDLLPENHPVRRRAVKNLCR